jgi:hypothetical protein
MDLSRESMRKRGYKTEAEEEEEEEERDTQARVPDD